MSDLVHCSACGLLVEPAEIGPDGTCCVGEPAPPEYDDCLDDGTPFPPEEEESRDMNSTDAAQCARLAIETYEATSREVRRVTDALADLELRRAEAKMAAVQRLIAEPHPATGKPMSVSAAEEYVLLDPAYQRYARDLRDLQLQKLELEARLHAAEMGARLYTACVDAGAALALVRARGPSDGAAR